MKTAYCFDLDGTITREEILPLLAHQVGIHEEIAALTQATISGVIPFKRSFLLRCRLLSEIPISRAQQIIGRIKLHLELERFIKENASSCVVITGNLDKWIEPLIERLGCRFYTSKAMVVDDKLASVASVLDKGEAIIDVRREFNRIVAVGDGMGDVQMFEQSDASIAFGAVHPPIQTLLKLSDFVTYDERALCRLLRTL